MKKLEEALYAKWISRFGRAKVKELAEGLDAGKSVADRSKAIVKASTEEELRALLLEGFDGFFHQTVYLRKLPKAQQSIDAIKKLPVRGKPVNGVVLEEVTQPAKGELRCLLMVAEIMEFLQQNGSLVSEEIPFPVAIGISGGNLIVQVLTMQIATETWGKILEKDLRRMLTLVHADVLCDEVLNFMRDGKVDVGGYVDYSVASVKFIKMKDIDTFSGTYEVGTQGSTNHKTLRGKGKKALRESMPDEFQKLVSAVRIVNAEAQLTADYCGLKQAAKVALYPTVGKMAFRSKLQGCDPDDFIKEMAKP